MKKSTFTYKCAVQAQMKYFWVYLEMKYWLGKWNIFGGKLKTN